MRQGYYGFTPMPIIIAKLRQGRSRPLRYMICQHSAFCATKALLNGEEVIWLSPYLGGSIYYFFGGVIFMKGQKNICGNQVLAFL